MDLFYFFFNARCQVSICDLDSDAGENAADQLSQTYGKDRVLFCHCDVTDYVQYEEAFQTTIAEFDGLDVVINNAEIMNDKFWELEVDVNLVNVTMILSNLYNKILMKKISFFFFIRTQLEWNNSWYTFSSTIFG